MDNKYYTPELGEFKLNFEYELMGEKATVWRKEKFNFSDAEHYFNTYFRTRVKCLDNSDIKECGWKVWGHTDIKALGSIDHFDLIHKGEIKNKSELLFLMKRLHITPPNQ